MALVRIFVKNPDHSPIIVFHSEETLRCELQVVVYSLLWRSDQRRHAWLLSRCYQGSIRKKTEGVSTFYNSFTGQEDASFICFEGFYRPVAVEPAFFETGFNARTILAVGTKANVGMRTHANKSICVVKPATVFQGTVRHGRIMASKAKVRVLPITV